MGDDDYPELSALKHKLKALEEQNSKLISENSQVVLRLYQHWLTSWKAPRQNHQMNLRHQIHCPKAIKLCLLKPDRTMSDRIYHQKYVNYWGNAGTGSSGRRTLLTPFKILKDQVMLLCWSHCMWTIMCLWLLRIIKKPRICAMSVTLSVEQGKVWLFNGHAGIGRNCMQEQCTGR